MATLLHRLLTEAALPYQTAVSMSRKTTLQVGGPAACWVEVEDVQALLRALQAAHMAGAPVTLVGNGSNLLVLDGGLPGMTLCLGRGMADIAVHDTGMTAKAGARMSQLALAAQAAGLSGLEALSGIPGTLGGGLFMNAGSYGVTLGALVVQVDAVDSFGAVHTLSGEAMAFGYRKSLLQQNGWIATAATLALQPDDPEAIGQRMRAYAQARREKQPLSLPSAGSFFKRPEGQYAGALIEAAGLKGYSVGGAQVSPMHAGFLVNTGGATASDFLRLMEAVQARVHAHSGIWLEAEVEIIGCDSSC